jgi:hypothetical protein
VAARTSRRHHRSGLLLSAELRYRNAPQAYLGAGRRSAGRSSNHSSRTSTPATNRSAPPGRTTRLHIRQARLDGSGPPRPARSAWRAGGRRCATGMPDREASRVCSWSLMRRAARPALITIAAACLAGEPTVQASRGRGGGVRGLRRPGARRPGGGRGRRRLDRRAGLAGARRRELVAPRYVRLRVHSAIWIARESVTPRGHPGPSVRSQVPSGAESASGGVKAASGGPTLHKLRHSRLTHLAEAGENVTSSRP